jgi:hypothetical protein
MTFPLHKLAFYPNKESKGGVRAHHMDDAIVSEVVNILEVVRNKKIGPLQYDFSPERGEHHLERHNTIQPYMHNGNTPHLYSRTIWLIT